MTASRHLPAKSPSRIPAKSLLVELRSLITQARAQVARTVDSGLTALYWTVGERINGEILKRKRANYGEQIVSTLGRQLEREFGRGFSEKSLRHMMRFAQAFPDKQIVSTLWRELFWSHLRILSYVDDPLKREFYAELCRLERWDVRTLEKKLGSMLFERTALAKKPADLVRSELAALRTQKQVSADLVFRDPYILDFLGLHGSYSEKDLETAILREMEAFLLELGVGFTFVARQKRITVGGVDHYLDLLFYHRHLRRLVALDLKLDHFTPADKGQMELYLAWLRENESAAGEETPIGLILCASKNDEAIRLLDLEHGAIRVASYWTKLVPRQALERKLHQAIRDARARLQNRPEADTPSKDEPKPRGP